MTVLCNLHTLETARTYCDRVIGMVRGKVVFNGPPAALTTAALRQIYGVQADQGAFDRVNTAFDEETGRERAPDLMPAAR
jgi:phosphonate transport system ATP-binding protein